MIREESLKPCIYCHIVFEDTSKSNNKRYCSHDCWRLARGRQPRAKECVACKEKFTDESRSNQKQYCGKECFHYYKSYGLNKIKVKNMLTFQKNRCKICYKILNKPHVDHCHTTGKVRGLLCRSCNTGIGSLNENITTLEAAMNYIKENREFKFIKVKDVNSPKRGHTTDAGIDFFVPNDVEEMTLKPGQSCLIKSGIKMIISPGLAGIFNNKSSIGSKGLIVGASVVDSSYRGEVTLNLWNVSNNDIVIKPGQKLVQMIIQEVALMPIVEISEEEFNNEANTERGEGGFGSTGA